MRVKQRNQFYSDAVPFPATKSASAVTIYGDELNPFGENPGALDLQLVAGDTSKITDNMTVGLEVSYDEGDSWVEVNEYSDLANGTGSTSVLKNDVLEFAPMVRLSGVFDGSAELAADHGCSVKAMFKENENFYKSKIFTGSDVITVPETSASETTNGETLSVENAQKVYVVSSGVTAKMTNVTFNLQSSFDGESWWDVGSSAKDISALSFNEEEFSDKLGTYFRVELITGATGLEEDHGLSFNVIALYN